MRRRLLVLIIAIAVLGGGAGIVVYLLRSTSNWADTLAWQEPDLSQVADGTYFGSASVNMPAGTVAANTTTTVKVTIKNHRYVSIEIVNPPAATGPMSKLAHAVVETQSVKPDSISGATVTKSLLLMAVANALTGIR